MIDYIALTIGHGLLAFAFWHLFLRAGTDIDPLIDDIRAGERANRKLSSTAGRNAARRTDEEPQAGPRADGEHAGIDS